MALYSLGPLIGPIMGPIVGGVITERAGVKYLFIFLACKHPCFRTALFRDLSEIDEEIHDISSNLILTLSLLGLSGLIAAVGIPLLRETYGPVLRYRKALKMGDVEKAMALSREIPGSGSSLLSVIWVNLKRPVTLLCRSFICFILSLYMAL